MGYKLVPPGLELRTLALKSNALPTDLRAPQYYITSKVRKYVLKNVSNVYSEPWTGKGKSCSICYFDVSHLIIFNRTYLIKLNYESIEILSLCADTKSFTEFSDTKIIVAKILIHLASLYSDSMHNTKSWYASDSVIMF